MKSINKAAAKAYDRIQGEYTEAADRDAAFDHGEWSGAAIDRMMHTALERVAARFGMTENEAFSNWMSWWCGTEDRFYEANDKARAQLEEEERWEHEAYTRGRVPLNLSTMLLGPK